MRIAPNKSNVIAFLLVHSDNHTSLDIDPTTIELQSSVNGGPFEDMTEPVSALGRGWYTTDFNPGDVEEGSPVIFIAKHEGSVEWRDIHDVISLQPPEWVHESRIAFERLNAAMVDLSEQMSEGFQAVLDAMDRIVTPEGADLSSILSDLRIVRNTVDPEPEPGHHTLRGSSVTAIPSVSVGNAREEEHNQLLAPWEWLGPDLIPEPWGRYDSSKGSDIVVKTHSSITMEYRLEGGNQQVYKVLESIPDGQYIFTFKLHSNDPTNGVEVRIRQHESPYTPVGYNDQHLMDTTFMKRITIANVNPGDRIRIQFSFDGMHIPPTTHHVKDLHLWRIEKENGAN